MRPPILTLRMPSPASGSKKERARTAYDHQGKTQQAKHRSFHPGMEVGENLDDAQILHFNDGLRHRGIFQRKPAASAFHIARVFHIGIDVVHNGRKNFALKHQKTNARQQKGQQPWAAQQAAQAVACLRARSQQQQAETEAPRPCQRRQSVGHAAQKQQGAPPARGHHQTHKSQQGHIVTDQIRKNRMPFLRPPRNDAGTAKQHNPLPAQGIAHVLSLFEARRPVALGLIAGKRRRRLTTPEVMERRRSTMPGSSI